MKTIFMVLMLLAGVSTKAQSYEINTKNDTINFTDANGKKQGIWVLRNMHQPKLGYPSGQTIEEGIYKDNKKTGIWTQYYKTGKIKSKITFVDGRPNGPSALYYENGTVKEEGTWTNNRWVGKYKSINENGDITEILFDDKGKELEKKVVPAKNSIPSKKK